MVVGREVLSRVESSVLHLTLNRADRLNALTVQMVEAVRNELRRDDLQDVKVVVLSGAGRGFSSGADLSAGDSPGPEKSGPEKSGPDESGQDESPLLDEVNRLVLQMHESPRIIIAAVNGAAAGAGCSLALAADIVVAAASARFHFPFVKVGLTADGRLSASLTAAIGRPRAMRLLLEGGTLSADEAREWGLVSETFDDDDFARGVHDVAQRLAAGPADAMAAIKTCVNAATVGETAEVLRRETEFQRRLRRSPDFAEAVRAFRQGRAPRFGQR